MPRNSSGTMTGANGPYIVGTTADPTLVNARFADEETELSDSLSRSGKGGMLAVLRNVDGTVAAPSVSFTSEPASGLYKAGTGDVRLAVGGVDAVQVTSTFVALAGAAPAIRASSANAAINLQGNRAATDTNADIAMTSLAVRTAGLLLDVQNQGGGRFQVDYQGLARLASQAAAIQPASIWTAITAGTGWTVSGDCAFFKDATGVVHLRGTATNNDGATATAFTLPAGYRPAVLRRFPGLDASNTTVKQALVNTDGTVQPAIVGPPTAAHVYLLDQISFVAEA